VNEVGTQGIAPLAGYHTIKGRRVTTSRVETLPWSIEQAEAVGLEPTTVLPAAVFKTVSSSGRVTSVVASRSCATQ